MMMGRARTTPPGRSETPSHKRDFTDMQNTTIDEELAKDRWYALKPEEITVMVGDMCDKLTIPMEKYASIDQRFQDFIHRAKAAKKLPDIKPFGVAILGEQGIGKSSLINAFLDRVLLDRSGSSKACTAYATVLEYKLGASDHSTLSDLLVEFFTREKIKYCIKEQIDRWVEFYPGVNRNRQPLNGEDENDPDEDDATQATDNKTSRQYRVELLLPRNFSNHFRRSEKQRGRQKA
jgi:hypothetical protein